MGNACYIKNSDGSHVLLALDADSHLRIELQDAKKALLSARLTPAGTALVASLFSGEIRERLRQPQDGADA